MSPSDQIDYWRRRVAVLEARLALLQRRKVGADLLLDHVRSLAPITYTPPDKVYTVPKHGARTPHHAVLLLSDMHVGQVVTEDQTLRRGRYNFELCLRRLAHLERTVQSIIQNHVPSGVDGLTVVMLGDMLHGALDHGAESAHVSTLFEQFYSAGHALAQFLRNLSALVPVTVHTVVGNHARWPSQEVMPTQNRYSNLDQFLYAYVAALLRDVPTIKFSLSKQPFAEFSLCGYRCQAAHGENLKGGDFYVKVPWQAINRHVVAMTQGSLANGDKPPQYFFFGHFHRPALLTLQTGEVLINGGFPGTDEYGITKGLGLTPPSQLFFLLHPKHGRAATYTVWLSAGDDVKHHYSLPDQFVCP